MASLRDIASCIGVANHDESFRVVQDFFGFYNGAPKDLSLLTQMKLLQGRHIHLNIILVGVESFTNSDRSEIDAAIQFTRDTYATVSLGVGRIEHYFITTAEADGYENIGGDGEAEDLTDDWTVPNGSFDVFFVLTYSGSTIGLSAVDGDCDKDSKGMTGSVVAIEGSGNTSGFVLAHEVGHYLGLAHTNNDGTNLMFPTVPNGGNLTSGQGSNMRDHCFVKDGC